MKSKFNMRASHRQSGLSMIELLVALAIGSFLIIGAVTLQSQSRRNFDVNEQQARLQENARYVIAVIEPQLQLAGVYGYSQDPEFGHVGRRRLTHAAEQVAHDLAAAPGPARRASRPAATTSPSMCWPR